MNGTVSCSGSRPIRLAAALVLIGPLAACGLLDPVVEDLEVTGIVMDLGESAISGARVELVRTTCSSGDQCNSRIRGQDVTGTDGRFSIVVERDQDEDELFDLVCHEFFLNVRADGYLPIEGSYAEWRNGFCSSASAEEIEFRLEPVA